MLRFDLQENLSEIATPPCILFENEQKRFTVFQSGKRAPPLKYMPIICTYTCVIPWSALKLEGGAFQKKLIVDS